LPLYPEYIVTRVNQKFKDEVSRFARDHKLSTSETTRLALVYLISQEAGT
jgi:hypothetical protein